MARIVGLAFLLWVVCARAAFVTSPYPPPLGASLFTVGTSLVPSKVNAATITATTTSGLNTFTCVTSCSDLYVGAALYAGGTVPSATVVTIIAGTTITVSRNLTATNASPIPIQVGYNRWSTTSSEIVNTLGVRQLWIGGAALGNSTWVEQYLPGECQYGYLAAASVTACLLLANGDNLGTFIGARTSDVPSSRTSMQNLTLLTVADDVTNPKTVWGIYNELRCLSGATANGICFGTEFSPVNFNAAVQTDPFTANVLTAVIGARIDCNNGNNSLGGLTPTDCSTAYQVTSNGNKYFTGFEVANGALNTSILTHPSAFSTTSGANGYALSFYKAAPYSTPAWQIWSTNTTNNGNFLSLDDTDIKWGTGSTIWAIGGTTTFTQLTASGSASMVGRRGDAVASGALAQFIGQGLNTTPATIAFGQININSNSNTAGAEAGSISFQVAVAGVETTKLNLAATSLNLFSGVGLQMNSSTVIDTSKNITAANISGTGLISTGTKFTTTGCSVSSTTGGATAGTFTLGANTCTVVIQMNGATGLTAPTGWTCQAHDRTGISVIIDGESSSTTTTASIVIPVTAGATDVIAFSCVGF